MKKVETLKSKIYIAAVVAIFVLGVGSMGAQIINPPIAPPPGQMTTPPGSPPPSPGAPVPPPAPGNLPPGSATPPPPPPGWGAPGMLSTPPAPGMLNQGTLNVMATGYDAESVLVQIPLVVSYAFNGVNYNVTVLNSWNPLTQTWNSGIDMPATPTDYSFNGFTYNYYVNLPSGNYYFNL